MIPQTKLYHNMWINGDEVYVLATVYVSHITICATDPSDTEFERCHSAGSYRFMEGEDILAFIFNKIDSLLL